MFCVHTVDGESAPPERLLDAIDVAGQAARRGGWHQRGISVAQTVLDVSPEHRRRELPTRCGVTGRLIASWIRLDDRGRLAAQLKEELGGVCGHRSADPTDPQLVLAAHLRWGDDAPRNLIGDFAYVIVDPGDGSVFAAVDPLAVRPCVFTTARGGVVVATSVAGVRAVPGLGLEPSDEWLAWFVAGQSSSRTGTPYPNVHRLDGGESLTARRGGSAVVRRYHEWRDDPPDARRRDDAWVEQFRERIEVAVADRLRTDGPVGVESSGGLDSSTCVAFAARAIGPERIHALGFVSLDAEPGLIDAVHRASGLSPGHEHLVGPNDERRAMPPAEVSRVLGHPAEHGNGPGHHELYLRCRELGAQPLLSGFGGDEVVTNPAGLLYEELVDRRRYLTLARNLHGPTWQRPLRFARVLGRHLRGSAGDQTLGAAGERMVDRLPLRDDVINRFGVADRIRHAHRYTAPYRRINDWILDERMAAGFVPTRLRDCSLLAQACGVEYAWPLWDRRLVQQYLSTPSIEKRGPGYGRYLHRRAIDGVVADEVTWRETKATGDPIVERARTETCVDVAHDALHVRLRTLLDRRRLDALVAAAATAGGPGGESRRAGRVLRSISVLDEWLRHDA